MTLRIAPIATTTPDAVEGLLDAAFGSGRRTRTAYRIREGMTAIPVLSYAAFEGGRLLGTLQSWPVALDTLPMILVGPVAVLPDVQRRRIGQVLMARLLTEEVRDPMVMIGDPEYYGRFFGFSADATQGWRVPGPVDPRRLLARAMGPLPATGQLGPRAFALAGASA